MTKQHGAGTDVRIQAETRMADGASVSHPGPPGGGHAAAVLQIRGVSKHYPGTTALRDVNLEIPAAECHGLLGQNGAGKSTLLKIISGAERPSHGEVLLDGVSLKLANPAEAQRAGIYAIYQELSLAPDLSVAENIYVSDLPTRAGLVVDWKALRNVASHTLNNLGFDIDVRRAVRTLSIAEQQAVEIAKALHHKARVLLLDEPSATLSTPDVAKLFETLRRLKASGVSIVYVSHRLDEIYAICDQLTVLRDGERVLTGAANELSRSALVRAMVGDRLISGLVGQSGQNVRRRLNPNEPPFGEPRLEVDGLSDATTLRNIALTVNAGEVVAVTGLVGAGQSELAGCLFGSRRMTHGRIRSCGKDVQIRSPRDAIDAGLGWVPEERKSQGLVLNMSMASNLSMANLSEVARFGFVSRRAEARLARQAVAQLDVKVRDVDQPVGALSGGNQQKVVFGKWLAAGSRILILSEPTRGVDVAAKEAIYEAIRGFLASGGSALVLSSEVDEALMCDRLYVIRQGRIAGELSHAEATPASLLALLADGPSVEA